MRARSAALLAVACLSPRLPPQQAALDVVRLTVSTDRPVLPHVEPVVAVHPLHPGWIAVAAMAVTAPHDDRFDDSWEVVVFVSTDDGASWTRRMLPPAPAGRALGDANLAWARDGSLYLTALVSHPDHRVRPWLWRSRDEGRSWTVERVPTAGDAAVDHPVLDVADGAGSPALAVFATVPGEGARAGIAASVRDPGRATFVPTTSFSPNEENNNLGWGVRLADGTLLFSYYSMSRPMPTPLRAVRSTDAGRTWTDAQITDRHIPVGFPMLAVDRSAGPRRGRVYAAWVSDEESSFVLLGHSDDAGRSWSAPTIVHRARSAVGRARPAVHVNRDGVVVVSWTDGRDDAAGRGAWCWDVYAAMSLDGGATFEEEERLTPAVTCSQIPGNGAAGRRWRWGGDYAGIASDSLGRFYVAWSDARTGVFQPYLARLDHRARGAKSRP